MLNHVLEAEVMASLWALHPKFPNGVTSTHIRFKLQEKGITRGATTIGTVLTRLEKKEWVQKLPRPNVKRQQWIWKPVPDKEKIQKIYVDYVLKAFFNNNTNQLTDFIQRNYQ